MILLYLGAWYPAIHACEKLFVELTVNLLWGGLHMTIHEIGHILAAWMVGSQIKQVGISKLGPFVRRTPAKAPWRNALVALAGPGINILTWAAFVAFGVSHAWIALCIGVVNLLPLPQSDLMKSLGYLRSV
jgi:membrane-associated protease RseP (regulator of RpoE activity)